MIVRVRFAPSPTGNPHVGNIRTALFDYLFARANRGVFILRIEDTDKTREVEESYQAIEDSLRWLGLNWDEGPTRQSDRLEIYKKYTDQLLKEGFAYQSEGAVYFKVKKEGQTGWTDLVGGKKIRFDLNHQEDFVLIRSNGYPTYHLASVIDDRLMEITHVMRGEEWISSTPKHLLLYEAFGWQPPQFAHLPTILATDRSKLSKRHGAVGVLDFAKDGYLPEALLNYLALLGWTPPSGKEVLTLEEMVGEFDLKDINPSPAIFDYVKLEWMNGEYIRRMSDEELTKRLQEFLVDHPHRDKIAPVVPLVKERIKKLSDFVPLTYFIWEKPEYDLDTFAKVKIEDKVGVLSEVVKQLEKLLRPWDAQEFENSLRKLAQGLQVPTREFFQLIRVAISGQLVTPPMFETIQVMGGQEAINRIKEAVKWLAM